MANRRARAADHHQALAILGRIAVDQVHANANANLEALTSSLSRDARHDDLSELARAVWRLVSVRPDLVYTSGDSSPVSLGPFVSACEKPGRRDG